MNILHIIPAYYPVMKYGGPIPAAHLLNKTLVKKAVNVDVFTTNAGLESENGFSSDEWKKIDDVKVKYFNYYGYDGYSFSPGMLVELFKAVERYDIIHIDFVWNFPFLAGSLAGLFRKKPYLVTPMGTIYKEAIYINSENKKMLYYKLIAGRCLKRASAIHFTSENEKDEVMDFLELNNRTIVIPHGLDLSEFDDLPAEGAFKQKYPAVKDKRYILFLGRINVKKGLDIIVKAFRELARIYEDLYLVVVGPDSEGYGEEVKMWLKESSLLDRAVFTGMLRGKEVLEAFVDAEAFILPSYSENFGMAVVEAMACGTPAIISDKVGIYREVEQNNGGIVVETNPQSLFEGIKRLLDNRELRREISKNGKRLVRQYYDINKVTDTMIKAYDEIIRAY